MARQVKRQGWTQERLARFQATMKAKKAAANGAQTAPPPAATEKVAVLAVNGKTYPIEEALAIYTAVAQFKHAIR